MEHISAPELAAWLADATRAAPLLLDVREVPEYQICHIPGSMHIPMHEIPGRLAELDEEAVLVCICHHGMRSRQVAQFLEHQGYTHVMNLTGGVHAWAVQLDPDMATY